MSLDAKRFKRSERRETNMKIAKARQEVRELRQQLANTEVVVASKPIENFSVYVASALVFLNAAAWFAIFGPASAGPNRTLPANAFATETAGGRDAAIDVESAAKFATAPAVANPHETTAVTVVEPVASLPAEPVVRVRAEKQPKPAAKRTARSKPKDRPRPPPSGPPPGTRKPEPKHSNVVAINDAAAASIKSWIADTTTKRKGAFLPATQAWEAFQETCGMPICQDYFYKVLKATLGERRQRRKDGVRGYTGMALALPEVQAKRAVG